MNAGLDTSKLNEWLVSNLDDSTPPFEFELIAAGGSNLTYKVRDSDGRLFALRRPPEGGVLASAHDMGREWKVMSALQNSAVPTPDCLAYCEDLEILGTQFYVMSFVDGTILRDTTTAPDITEEQAETATNSLIQTQIEMHTVDLEAVGLADLSKREDYVGRQLKRWKKQIDAAPVRDLPIHDDLYNRLLAAKPAETAPPSLVHGDYRFDNCVLNKNWEISAVLDWELCTIGNPMADFIWSLQYWANPEDEFSWIPKSPTIAPAFMNREQYCSLFQAKSDLDFSDIHYYTIFSWWKQSSIVEGVNARLMAGGGGGLSKVDSNSNRTTKIATRVDHMLEHANSLAKGVI